MAGRGPEAVMGTGSVQDEEEVWVTAEEGVCSVRSVWSVWSVCVCVVCVVTLRASERALKGTSTLVLTLGLVLRLGT